jgi:hypothetical protein
MNRRHGNLSKHIQKLEICFGNTVDINEPTLEVSEIYSPVN